MRPVLMTNSNPLIFISLLNNTNICPLGPQCVKTLFMSPFLRKICQSIQSYFRYFNEALIEVYFYYSSPWPIHLFLRKWVLANRSLRIIWSPNSKGRKPLERATISLILEMKRLNTKWGAQKISDELSKIGHKASKKTVLKYLEFYGLNHNPPIRGPSWSEFINNHKFKIGIDFTSLISLMGHQLCIFIIIDLDTRELIFINVTYNPDFQWIKQQFRNAFFDRDDYPTLCICDNDSIFQTSFEKMLKDYFKIKLKRIPYNAPHKNGVVERFHGSLKSEAFKNVIPINLLQAQRISREYQNYYNHYRPHQGLHGKIPRTSSKHSQTQVNFNKKEHLGGKITSFEPNIANIA